MSDINGVERVLSQIGKGNTLVHQHPECESISALIVDWCLESEARRPSFSHLCSDITDKFAQDGSLGVNPESTLAYFRDQYVAERLHLSAAWMAKGAMKTGTDLNLLRQHGETLKQHQKSLDIIDKAIDLAMAKVESSGGDEGTGNLDTLLQRRDAALARKEATLKAMLDLQLTLGLVEDQKIAKSVTVHHNTSDDVSQDIMNRTRRRMRPDSIEVKAREKPED